MFCHTKKSINNTSAVKENKISTNSNNANIIKKVAEAPKPENIQVVDFKNKTKDKIKIKYF